MGKPIVYRTADEIHYLRYLFLRNRRAFLSAADLTLHDRRSWEGEGMRVNVKKVKYVILELLKQHGQEFPQGLPPEKSRSNRFVN